MWPVYRANDSFTPTRPHVQFETNVSIICKIEPDLHARISTLKPNNTLFRNTFLGGTVASLSQRQHCVIQLKRQKFIRVLLLTIVEIRCEVQPENLNIYRCLPYALQLVTLIWTGYPLIK